MNVNSLQETWWIKTNKNFNYISSNPLKGSIVVQIFKPLSPLASVHMTYNQTQRRNMTMCMGSFLAHMLSKLEFLNGEESMMAQP